MSPFPYDRRSGRFANLRCKTIRPLNWVLLSVAPEFLCRSKGCLGVTWHLYLRYRHGEFTRGSPDRYLKIRSFRGPGWRGGAVRGAQLHLGGGFLPGWSEPCLMARINSGLTVPMLRVYPTQFALPGFGARHSLKCELRPPQSAARRDCNSPER